MNKIRRILSCNTVQELIDPSPDSVKGYFCTACNKELWVKERNTKLDMPKYCIHCAEAMMEHAAKQGQSVIAAPASVAHNPNEMREIDRVGDVLQHILNKANQHRSN